MGTPFNRLDSIWPQSKRTELDVAAPKHGWADSAKGWEHRLESLLAKNPKLAIAAAAAAGLVLGWIVKRK
jgi:ElaB/YqjD/DUF883 family membrane-anchored ribosome-binding protein